MTLQGTVSNSSKLAAMTQLENVGEFYPCFSASLLTMMDNAGA